jgi:hypothetical protein
LSKLRDYYYGSSAIPNIQEIETFETWFNGNCGWVINYDYSASSSYPYWVWIVVYEPPIRNMGTNLSAIKHDNYSSLSSARNKVQELKRKLQNNAFSDTPMLEVHSKANSYEYFSSLITNPYVVKRYLPSKEKSGCLLIGDYPSSPSSYIRPLDIVKVDEGDYEHVGIYLGNNEICHYSKKYKGTRIHDWGSNREFLKDGIGDLTCYHPIIPFKHYEKIAKQIAWAYDVNFRGNGYNLVNRNCEHFANMMIYGINYSEQIEDKRETLNRARNFTRVFFSPFTWTTDEPMINNDKGSTINLTNEMRETEDKLGWRTNSWSRQIENQARQEVPPKEYCRIM